VLQRPAEGPELVLVRERGDGQAATRKTSEMAGRLARREKRGRARLAKGMASEGQGTGAISAGEAGLRPALL
jgi:hypothetical protein